MASANAVPTGIFSFQNHDLFGPGFKSGVSFAECSLMQLISHDILNMDGTIDRQAIATKHVEKKALWKYVYYLWYHNHTTLDIFRGMSNEKNQAQASAFNFVHTVLNTLGKPTSNAYHVVVTLEDLADFVNYVLAQSNGSIVIPFIEKIRNELLRRLNNVRPQQPPLGPPQQQHPQQLLGPGAPQQQPHQEQQPSEIRVFVKLLPEDGTGTGIKAQTKIT